MKKFFAFSLAEALITLLIVSLIALASVPVITKKRRNIETQNHGMFACYWDGNSLKGVYKVNGITRSGTTKFDGTEGRWGCVFTPPSNAKNFVVTIVGGGGGGAAGYTKSYKKTFTPGSTVHNIDATGTYDAIIVGGGGGGGGSKGGCSDPDCGGGGSSAAVAGFKNSTFKKGDSLSFIIGAGGSENNGKRDYGDRGGESKIVLTRSGAVIDIVKAGGGGGGYGRGNGGSESPKYRAMRHRTKATLSDSSSDHVKDTNFVSESEVGKSFNLFSQSGGEAYVNSSYVDGSKITGNGARRGIYNNPYYCRKGSENSYCQNRTLAYTTHKSYFGIDQNSGAGGRGDRDGGTGPVRGTDGVGVLKWNQGYSGHGGKAGKVLQLPFAQLPPNTLVFPGKGGQGGRPTAYATGGMLGSHVDDGKAGQASYIKNYAQVAGGERTDGLNPNNESSYNESSAGGNAKGGHGELANISPTDKPVGGAGAMTYRAENGYVDNGTVNGHTRPMFNNGVVISDFKNLVGAGAGGGGGGASGNSVGNGGNGSSGIVFIQW